jgi:hypothetical protein
MYVAQAPARLKPSRGFVFLFSNGARTCIFLHIPFSNRFIAMSSPQRDKFVVVQSPASRAPNRPPVPLPLWHRCHIATIAMGTGGVVPKSSDIHKLGRPITPSLGHERRPLR